MRYAHTVTVDLSFAEAVQATRQALTDQGFGVLTEIDVASVFTAKLGAAAATEVGEQLILGACNPQLAHRALRADPDVGVLLPCNVVIRHRADTTVVQALDPQLLAGVSENAEVAAVAADADARLRAALDVVAARSATAT